MERPERAPKGIDADSFSAARVYDYMLGGSHNFAVDREMARRGLSIMPDLAVQAQLNRAFMHRAVRHLIRAGIRQFIDLGSGILTRANVHDVAELEAVEVKVAYVDIDPIAVAQSQQLLVGNPRAIMIREDMRHPEAVLNHPRLRALIDLDQPVAVLLLAILQAIPDEENPYGIVARLRDALVPGSYLVVAHVSAESRPEVWAKMVEMSMRTFYSLTPRARADVARLFDGFDLVEPGVVWAPQWRPEHLDDVGDDPGRSSNLVGVGRKR